MAADVAAWAHSVKAVTQSFESEGVRRAAAAAMAAARPWVTPEEAALECPVEEAAPKPPFEGILASHDGPDIAAANENSRAASTAQIQHQVPFSPTVTLLGKYVWDVRSASADRLTCLVRFTCGPRLPLLDCCLAVARLLLEIKDRPVFVTRACSVCAVGNAIVPCKHA